MVLYGLSALAGIALGLLQARWTVRLVTAAGGGRSLVLPLLIKLLLWAAVMAGLALYSPPLLIAFAVAAGLSMTGATLALYLRSRGQK